MLYQQIAKNKRKTVFVLAGFLILVALIGAAIGYLFAGTAVGGIIIAGVLAVIYMSVIVSQSTDVVMNMNNAREIHSAQEAPELWHVVEDMAMVAQVPMPRVFIIDDPSPNAFATGNDPQHSAVAATTGLLQIMNREELEGVMGHEMSHVRNYDIRLQTIALALSAAITALVNFAGNFWWFGGGRSSDDDDDSAIGIFAIIGSILLIILAPLAASIAQMALSRNREYLADAGAVELTRNPHGLISALQKLQNAQPMKKVAPSSSSLYISDPELNRRHKRFAHLFDTHPPLDERIARLEEM
ncbi:zinc metalloprotease HtpX [Limosilactobacillus vaginalis]|jgi:heat shock protein HtpX|uniref:Protease HtpX homolog n=2 Tax=Limosilactobacillus vaginalis TaxID=1633 RepID=A0AAW5WRY2_9LACO|nr:MULTISPECIES: zinc metalloprotease HtpX [Limosilactobacillus]PEH04694.1 zinc metalloprotease HtpX [Lactobacillus sp. UMNPBX5]EEJ41459.1 peptidase, M48 family [Limosilactobacillus vaginalis DSM 5837 = ATCC 49540]KRM48390.1 heat shock protein HtpX [Limosilactobacillus vaginalis DSM 5837 = ATCC 49540]MCI6853197.1 zinc metalloprotease HtpX [Limosilactobacillus vaginalis]MCZ3667301.1 zinc metalloprotease HtpX [Limosilactobacillus vaginalis]